MWNMMSPDGQAPKGGKMFLPDGRMYGYAYNEDGTDISTWIMANYDVVNDSTYVEHIFFHTDITYQSIDLEMNYKVAPDHSAILTTYTYVQPNGNRQPTMELWVRDTIADHQKFIERAGKDWDALHQQALKEYDRVPAEGETIEQKGEKLSALIQESLKNNQLDNAYAAYLTRAELDPTNIQWQQDLVTFYHAVNIAPTPAITYAKRLLSLAKAQAATPTDSTLQGSVFSLARFHTMQGNYEEGYQLLRDHLAAEEASQSQLTESTAALYNMMSGVMCYKTERWEEAYDYAMKSAKILEDTHSPYTLMLARDYNCAAGAKVKLEAYQEAISLYEKELKTIPSDAPDASFTKEQAEALLALSLQAVGTKEAKSRMKEMLKDKVWAVKTENRQDSIALALGLKGNATYYPLINEELKWTLNSPTSPVDLRDFHAGKDRRDDETTQGMKAFMNEQGDIITYTGRSRLKTSLLLKPSSPELKARLQKAFREAKAKAKK